MLTSELTDAALNWAVAKCEGWVPTNHSDPKVRARIVERINKRGVMACEHASSLRYSTDWSQGGPIIEREGMTISHSPYDHVFYEFTRPWCAEKKGRMEYGSTPLIAAMRCLVASKLGDEVEIPEELT